MSTSNSIATKNDLTVPVYLNTTSLLDLLASIEDGFSIAEKITNRSNSNDAIDRSIQGGVGLGNILNFLKLDLNATRSTKTLDEHGQERQTDRYHTYGSLLHRLRGFLVESALIKNAGVDGSIVPDWASLRTSDFIEVKGVIRPHPFVNWLNTVNGTIEITNIMTGFSALPGSQGNPAPTKKSNPPSQANQLSSLKKLFEGIRSTLEPEGIRTFLVDIDGSVKYTAVMSLFTEFLRDKSTRELEYGEFTVLGKVVRHFDRSSSESINLLNGTGFSGFGDQIMDQLIAALNTASNDPSLKLPQVSVKISPPVVHILPIAIYV